MSRADPAADNICGGADQRPLNEICFFGKRMAKLRDLDTLMRLLSFEQQERPVPVESSGNQVTRKLLLPVPYCYRSATVIRII